MNERRLPSVIYNSITMTGGMIAGISLFLILFLVTLDSLTGEAKPYMGIIAFVILPVFLILGLVLVAAGAWRQHRRRARGLPSTHQLPIVNLNDPRTRRAFAIFTIGTVLFLALSAFGSYKAYEYTDSVAFCGQTCHEVMHPEHTAYQHSAHARVKCVECHIGPGAEWFARSKLSGLYQVYSTLFNKYPRPIETPIHNLRPSRDTCEQCHWPAHFYEQNFIVHDYYLPNDENTPFRLNLLVKIGGGHSDEGVTEGIHFHMYVAKKVEYVATDEERMEIPWVRVTYADGTQKVYRSSEAAISDEDLAQHELRLLDCIDCHNRPSHVYRPPAPLVNEAMALGAISRDLPSIKSVAVEALEGEYESTAAALEGISQSVRAFYESEDGELARARSAEINRAIEELQRIYQANYFPEVGVSWKAFPNNIGHLYAPGCFRCHDGLHVAEDGHAVSRDCNICHTILAQETVAEGERIALGGVEYRHPEDIGDAWKETSCSDCHAG